MGKLIDNESISKDLLKDTAYEKESKVAELKARLADTDYKAIKFAEGEITAAEYEPTKIQRRQWREQINELQGENSESDLDSLPVE